MKRFYSCIDGGLSAPQPMQHLAIRDMSQKAGGAVTFYGAEEVKVLRSQPFIITKLRRLQEKNEVDGVIFYTLHQFRYGSHLNFQLLRQILGSGLETHFARERICLLKPNDLEAIFPFLLSVDYTLRRDRSEEWQKLVSSVNLADHPVMSK